MNTCTCHSFTHAQVNCSTCMYIPNLQNIFLWNKQFINLPNEVQGIDTYAWCIHGNLLYDNSLKTRNIVLGMQY